MTISIEYFQQEVIIPYLSSNIGEKENNRNDSILVEQYNNNGRRLSFNIQK